MYYICTFFKISINTICRTLSKNMSHHSCAYSTFVVNTVLKLKFFLKIQVHSNLHYWCQWCVKIKIDSNQVMSVSVWYSLTEFFFNHKGWKQLNLNNFFYLIHNYRLYFLLSEIKLKTAGRIDRWVNTLLYITDWRSLCCISMFP